MAEEKKAAINSKITPAIMKEGVHYYFEKGLMVFTRQYHLERGYCCGNGCRECPYPKKGKNKILK